MARWAHGVVIDWTLRITRGLPADVARDRFDQIVSDLWDQEADAGDRDGVRLAASLLVRAARGVPADLGWRHRALAAAPEAPRSRARSWAPLADERPFDQTNGAVDLGDALPHLDDGAEVRDLLRKGAAANAAFGLIGGGGL